MNELKVIRTLGVAALASACPLMPAFAAGATQLPQFYGGLSDEQASEVDAFALNNAIGTVFHEAGHMLVSEFSLPVLGREEDAVDALAAIVLLEAEDDELDVTVQDVVDGWFLLAELTAESEADYATWDSHGLHEQRAYAWACMMVGKSPEKFGDYARQAELPDYRWEQCRHEYQAQLTSWDSLLEPHLADEGEETRFTVRYEPTSDPTLAYYRRLLEEAQVLEMVAETFSGLYRLEDGIRLTATTCGEPNAYWHPAEREMTLCYEDVALSAQLDAKWYADNPDEQ